MPSARDLSQGGNGLDAPARTPHILWAASVTELKGSGHKGSSGFKSRGRAKPTDGSLGKATGAEPDSVSSMGGSVRPSHLVPRCSRFHGNGERQPLLYASCLSFCGSCWVWRSDSQKEAGLSGASARGVVCTGVPAPCSAWPLRPAKRGRRAGRCWNAE